MLKTGINIEVAKNVIDDHENYERFFDNAIPEESKPQFMSACATIFDIFCRPSESKEHQLFLHNCGYGRNKGDSDSCFLSLSKIIYGTNIFYLNLRQFLVFYYRSLSILNDNHPFYMQENIILMLFSCLNRLYGDTIPHRFFTKDMELNLLKKRVILSTFSDKLSTNNFSGDYQDLSIFASIFEYDFVVVEGRSNEFVLPLDKQTRTWKFNFKSPSQDTFINDCVSSSSTWIACYDEEFFLHIESIDDYEFEDLSMLPNGIGAFNRDILAASNMVSLLDSPIKLLKSPEKNPNRDQSQYLPPPIVKNVERFYNRFVNGPSQNRYLGKGKKKFQILMGK